jgi:hypothetical protein
MSSDAHSAGNGETPNGPGPRPTLEEALAAFGEPRDRLDRLALFLGQQTISIAGMIETQTRATIELMKLVSDQVGLLASEVASLREQRADEERTRTLQ